MDLGAANICVAMVIAITKATLVVLFFMHLWDEGGVNRLVFVVSLLFVAVLMLGVFGDLMTRLPITLPNDGPLPMPTGVGHGSPLPPAPADTDPHWRVRARQLKAEAARRTFRRLRTVMIAAAGRAASYARDA